MKHKDQNFFKAHIFLIFLLILMFGVLRLYLNKDASIKNDLEQNHLENNHSSVILSLSEISDSSSRFKLRYVMDNSQNHTPESLTLTNIGGTYKSLKLIKAVAPYECYDSHDYGEEKKGYETSWVSGNLEDYNVQEVKLTLNDDGEDLTGLLPIAHFCTLYSDNGVKD